MDVVPLSISLPRWVIVPARSSSTAGVVDVVVRGRIFGMRGVLSLSGRIGRRGRFSLFSFSICVGLWFFDWVVRVIRQISEDRGDCTSEEGKDGVEGMVGGLGESGMWNKR